MTKFVNYKIKIMKDLKINQRVIIRDDLEKGKSYGKCEVHPMMQEFYGEEVTIVSISDIGFISKDVRIKEDNGVFSWSPKMFK